MLKLIRHCECCGAELDYIRNTKTFCSDACRKKASRGGDDFDGVRESWWLFKNLRRSGLIGQIWPVYRWDISHPIFALLVPFEYAVDEMNDTFRRIGVAERKLPTEADYKRALKDFDVAISGEDAGDRLKAANKTFYDGRKDRRISKWDR
jgi:hypothetical protein